MPQVDAARECSSDTATPRRSLRCTAGLFLLSMLLAALAVVALGCLTQLKQMMHGTLVSIAIFALLPFVLIACGVAVCLALMSLCIMGAMLGAGDPDPGLAEPFIEAGVWLMPRYYGWLGRRRHPVFWGILAGLLAGGLALWGWIAVFILPGETRTAQILVELQQRVEQVHKETGRYPAGEDGRLTHAALGDPSQSGLVLDGFRRPVEYHGSGKWKLASYELRSHGADGRRGSDDLVVSGATKLAKWAQVFSIERSGNKRVSIRIRLEAVRDMRRKD